MPGKDQDKVLDRLVERVIELLDGWTDSADEAGILAYVENVPRSGVDSFLQKLKERGYLEQLFEDLDGKSYDALLKVLSDKGATPVLDNPWWQQILEGMGMGIESFAVSIPEGIAALFQSETWSGLYDLGFMAFVLNPEISRFLPDEVVEEQRDKATKMFVAIAAKFEEEWDAAEAQGLKTELIARWSTQGVLEVASMFVGVGEVKAAITATRTGAKAASAISKIGKAGKVADEVADLSRVIAALEEAFPDHAAEIARRLKAAKDPVRVARGEIPDGLFDGLGLTEDQISRTRRILNADRGLRAELYDGVVAWKGYVDANPLVRQVYGLTEDLRDAWVKFCRDNGVVVQLRPSTRKAGRAPKPEAIKAKTADEIDVMISTLDRDAVGEVVLIQHPSKPPDYSSMTEATKKAIDDRIAFREAEYAQHAADIRKLDGVELAADGRVINRGYKGKGYEHSELGVGEAFTGDVDMWAIYDAKTGELVRGSRAAMIVRRLTKARLVEHGAQVNWMPISQDKAVKIYADIAERGELVLQVDGMGRFRQASPGGRIDPIATHVLRPVSLDGAKQLSKPSGWSRISPVWRVALGTTIFGVLIGMFSLFTRGSDVAAAPAIVTTTTTTTTTTTSAAVVPPPTSSTTTTTTAQVVEPPPSSSSTTTTTTTLADGASGMPGSDKARPQLIEAMLAGSGEFAGEVWLHIVMYQAWGLQPPAELFSLFWALTVSYNPTAEVGWQTHDGVETILGSTPEAYILDDGSLLVATGLFPTPPFTLSIDARFGSWVEEAGDPAIFDDDSLEIDSESIEEGDPVSYFGAEPVFDLVAGN